MLYMVKIAKHQSRSKACGGPSVKALQPARHRQQPLFLWEAMLRCVMFSSLRCYAQK